MKTDDGYVVKKILRPGKPGTKKYVREYGVDLACIRHRYCKSQGKKQITAELIIEEKDWLKDNERIPPNKLLGIRVSLDEKYVRSMIKDVGAKWDPQKKLWFLAYQDIQSLGLTERIVKRK